MFIVVPKLHKPVSSLGDEEESEGECADDEKYSKVVDKTVYDLHFVLAIKVLADYRG